MSMFDPEFDPTSTPQGGTQNRIYNGQSAACFSGSKQRHRA